MKLLDIIYKYNLNNLNEVNINLYNKNIPIYYLGDDLILKIYKITPMAEEIIIKDNYLYVLNSSVSKKFIW